MNLGVVETFGLLICLLFGFLKTEGHYQRDKMVYPREVTFHISELILGSLTQPEGLIPVMFYPVWACNKTGLKGI